MLSTLHCRAAISQDSSPESLGSLISIACGLIHEQKVQAQQQAANSTYATAKNSGQGDKVLLACEDISPGDGFKGQYGRFAGCRPYEKLSWVYNAYYVSQKRKPGACDFDKTAKRVRPNMTFKALEKCDGMTEAGGGDREGYGWGGIGGTEHGDQDGHSANQAGALMGRGTNVREGLGLLAFVTYFCIILVSCIFIRFAYL
jgi:hypothetical protein